MSKELNMYKFLTVFFIILSIILFSRLFFYSPTNSLELHSWLLQPNNIESLQSDIFIPQEGNSNVEMKDTLLNQVPYQIKQFTFIEYGNKNSIIVETSPGLEKLEVLKVIDLNENVEEFLKNYEEN